MGLAGIESARTWLLCDVLVRFGTEAQKKTVSAPSREKANLVAGICLSRRARARTFRRSRRRQRATGTRYIVTARRCGSTNGRRAKTLLLMARRTPQRRRRIAHQRVL